MRTISHVVSWRAVSAGTGLKNFELASSSWQQTGSCVPERFSVKPTWFLDGLWLFNFSPITLRFRYGGSVVFYELQLSECGHADDFSDWTHVPVLMTTVMGNAWNRNSQMHTVRIHRTLSGRGIWFILFLTIFTIFTVMTLDPQQFSPNSNHPPNSQTAILG